MIETVNTSVRSFHKAVTIVLPRPAATTSFCLAQLQNAGKWECIAGAQATTRSSDYLQIRVLAPGTYALYGTYLPNTFERAEFDSGERQGDSPYLILDSSTDITDVTTTAGGVTTVGTSSTTANKASTSTSGTNSTATSTSTSAGISASTSAAESSSSKVVALAERSHKKQAMLAGTHTSQQHITSICQS